MEKDRITVLAIDDDLGDLELLRRYLEDIPGWNIDFFAFNDWQAGCVELKRRVVSVIFLDYVLGAETGLGVLKVIRDSGDKRPVVVMTGQGDEYIASEITRAGADDYLVKRDLNPDMLRRVIIGARSQYQLRKEKEQLIEALQKSQKMEALGTLVGGIAHDFNNLLMGIMGYAEIATIEYGKGKGIEKRLKAIQTSCQQMAELVQRLLTFSRCRTVGRSFVDVTEIIREVEVILSHSLSKKVQMSVELSAEAKTLYANPAMLRQVLLNLCINASDAMPEGGILSIRTEKTIVGSDFMLSHPTIVEGEYILLEVQDTGIGMTPEIRRRIFEPFFTTKGFGPNKGTGLGLAIVWQNIKDHNGLITVYSEPGQGTTFRVYLPATPGNRYSEEHAEHSNAEEGLPKGTETLLLVEDEERIRDLVGEMLQSLGYQVYYAADGMIAVETYLKLQKEISAVMLDVSMPKMGGKECFSQLLKINPDVRVLFCSGHDMAAESKELMAMGAKCVIQKPYLLGDLEYKLREVLER